MVTVHLDKQYLNSKEQAKSLTKTISKRICGSIEEVTPELLANEVAKGKSFVAGIMKDNERKKRNLLYQQVIALDFDDGTRIDDLVANEFIKEHASFIYMTLSNTDDFNKSRVVFILDKKLTSNEQIEQVYNKLFEIFPNVDKACKDSSRIFFGGKDFIEINFNNTFYIEDFITDLNIENQSVVRVDEKETVIDPRDKPTWWLMRHGYDDIVKERLSVYKASVEQQSVAMNYFNSLNMREVLGFKKKGNIHDLFSHDENPSVSVYEIEDGGVWLYTRHSDDPKKKFTGNLLQVVARLKKTHFIGALNYLIEMTETDFNSSDVIKQLNTEIEIYTSLLNSKDLRFTSPNIYRIFKDGRSNYSSDVIQILQIFKNNVVEIDGEIRMISQLSSRELAIMIYGDKKKKDRILKVLNLMTTTDWIIKLDEKEIPSEIRQKIIEYKENKNRRYYKNIFEFIQLGGDFFEKLDGKCGDLIESNFSAKSTLTKIGLENALGRDEANKVFNQDKKRNINEITKLIEDEAVAYIFKQIEAHGYVEEREVITFLSEVFTKNFSEFKFKQVRPMILKGYDLKRCRLNKALKKEFDVLEKYEQTQAPSIFIKTN